MICLLLLFLCVFPCARAEDQSSSHQYDAIGLYQKIDPERAFSDALFDPTFDPASETLTAAAPKQEYRTEGLLAVVREGKYGFVDEMGRLVTPCEWDDAAPFSEGLAWVGKTDASGARKYGFIDISGALVIPCQWDDAGDFRNGFTWVEKDAKYGAIDRNGALAVPCEYDDIVIGSDRFFLLKDGDLTIILFDGTPIF